MTSRNNRRPPANRPTTAREVALDTLHKIGRDKAFSNLQLNRALVEADLSRADAGLATELVYGTIQRQGTLDYWLGKFVAKGLEKLEPWVLQLLRMSVYQLVYLDRIPPHAAVNEAVLIAKRRGHSGIAGMINGVLRSMQRRREELTVPADGKPEERIALQHSYPLWLVRRWIGAYGVRVAEAMCASGNVPPKASIRINPLRMSAAEALERLRGQGMEAERSRLAPSGVTVARGGNLADTPGYRDGCWSVQDESSMLVAEIADPRPGMQVLDCCAAPGGKTAHMAEKMNDEGRIWANDLHPHKRKLIDDQASRLGLTCIRTMNTDAAALAEFFPAGSMDGRKPEVKWTKSPDDIKAVTQVQSRLLDAVAGLVRPGGVLVYSTCTVERSENEDQVIRFLEEHPDFKPDPQWPEAVTERLKQAGVIKGEFAGMIQLLPQHFESDGFFIARLRKRV